MRISELSSQTGVPVATIKFYLREGLLHEGVRTSATQAQYEESHVARLRLIRALLGPGGLSVAAAHRVIQAIEEPPASVHDLLAVAAHAVARPGVATDRQPRVEKLMQHSGWQIDKKDHPTYAALEDALRHSTKQVSNCLRERSTCTWSTCARSQNTKSKTSRPTHRPPPCVMSCWAQS